MPVKQHGRLNLTIFWKFSSNVVEKCLKLGGEESKGNIIRELTSSSRLSQLLQDPFANYVVQSALTVAKVKYGVIITFIMLIITFIMCLGFTV